MLEITGTSSTEKTGNFEVEVGDEGKLIHSKQNGDGYVDTIEKEKAIVNIISEILGVEPKSFVDLNEANFEIGLSDSDEDENSFTGPLKAESTTGKSSLDTSEKSAKTSPKLSVISHKVSPKAPKTSVVKQATPPKSSTMSPPSVKSPLGKRVAAADSKRVDSKSDVTTSTPK